MSIKSLHRTKEEPYDWKDGDLPADPANLRTYKYLTWEDLAAILSQREGVPLKGITIEDGGIELTFEYD